MVVIMNLPPPEEGIKFTEPNTKAFYKEQNLGKGTLYIAESRVCWVSNEGQGFSLQYTTINLHAISKDCSSFPEQCLYLMISEQLDEPEAAAAASNEDSDSEEEDDENQVNEIRFVPDNKDVLDIMFKAMSDCQALHPDPEQVDSEEEAEFDDDEEGNYEDAEGDDVIYYADGGQVHEVHMGAGGDTHNSAAAADGQGSDYYNGQDEAMEVGQFEDAEQPEQEQ